MSHLDPPPPAQDPLPELDRRARAAARGLRDHVDRHVEPDLDLARLSAPPTPARRGRLLVAAVVTLLMLGGLAIAGTRGGGVRIDDDHPVPPPTELTPLGPRDGKDSLGLPIEVEPNVGLADGDKVTVRGDGFAPGETVALVQCAREAGRTEKGGAGAGVDACFISRYTSLEADGDGGIEGTYEVTRFLTTPLTGTIDCAAEEGRCLVAAGALSDYDRSGGLGISFAGGEPSQAPDLPTLEVSPADGLVDREVVHVSGTGYPAGEVVQLNVCSIDPAGCWATGQSLYGGDMVGLEADGDGRIEGDVPVWQFLPVAESGHYADCAVSTCHLRVTTSAGTAPTPVVLGFEPATDPPTAPAIAAYPDEGLRPGEEVDLVGDGFAPGAVFDVLLCVGPAPIVSNETSSACTGDGEPIQADEQGVLRATIELFDPGSAVEEGVMATTTVVANPGAAPEVSTTAGAAPPSTSTSTCDGVTSFCSLVFYQLSAGGLAPPTFAPPPTPITFRPV